MRDPGRDLGFPLDERGVYRVAVPADDGPEARLCIGPRMVGKNLAFFDTLRERVLAGRFLEDKRASSDAVVFQVDDGERLFIEPLTLSRWNEIKHEIDGRPELQSDDEIRAFYLEMID